MRHFNASYTESVRQGWNVFISEGHKTREDQQGMKQDCPFSELAAVSNVMTDSLIYFWVSQFGRTNV